jgi:hypothetical protein
VKFLRKSLRRHGLVETIVTDRLASYGAALKAMGAIEKREFGRWLNNRVEKSLRGPSVPTSRSDDWSGRCCAFGKCEVCRNSPPSTARSPTNSLRGPAVQPGTHPYRSADFRCADRRFKVRRTAALTAWRQICAA